MSSYRSAKRGVLTLAVFGTLTALILMSPVHAAGNITKEKVYRIAVKAFNERAAVLIPALIPRCPVGTLEFGGACMEATSRPAQDFFASSSTCATAGRRLPTFSELWAWRDSGHDLDGDGASGEGTSELDFDNNATFRWNMRDDGATSLSPHMDPQPFRCVAEKALQIGVPK